MLTMVKQQQDVRLQGVVVRTPEAAEELQFVVLNSLGEVVSKTSKNAVEAGLVALELERDVRNRLSDGLAFGLIKGLRKGVVVWERRLGRLSL